MLPKFTMRKGNILALPVFSEDYCYYFSIKKTGIIPGF